MVTVYAAWGPVTITWLLLFVPNLLGPKTTANLFFYASLNSIIGPLVGYFAPMITLILAYGEKRDTGLYVTSKTHFWLGWGLAGAIIIFSIAFEYAFLPGIRIWRDIQLNPTTYDELGSKTADLEDGPIVFTTDLRSVIDI